MAGKLVGYLQTLRWWQLLLVATVSGIVVGVISIVLGLFCSIPIGLVLAHGQKITELGDAALGMFAAMTFGATGMIAGFSSVYGIARRRGYVALAVTCIALAINIGGFFVPTGGYAMLPFYASIAIGLSLTVVFLILCGPRSEN
jgi:hypothetical protein